MVWSPYPARTSGPGPPSDRLVISTLLIVAHVSASVILAAYGAHRLSLAWRFRQHVAQSSRTPVSPPTSLPPVTVQLPLYNEQYVAARGIEAIGALHYPSDRLQIQVLDDSVDETTVVAREAVARLRRRGLNAQYIQRSTRAGFKAGALAAGLDRASGELVAVFDADFVPRPDFLLQLVGEFSDPSVAMVQARWGHLNAGSSLLTRAQALQIDAHFTIEHGVRAATGCFFNFNGTAGVWRRRAIDAAGGWSAETLTEDLDLSLRTQLTGWRFVYRDDVEAPAELPVEVAGYRIQQQRWAQGGIQTAKKLLPRILRASLPFRVKLEAFWQLTGHATYPTLVVLALTSIVAGWLISPAQLELVFAIDGALLLSSTLALSVFYGVAARSRGTAGWNRRLLLVPVIMLLGAGIALGQAAAVLRGIRGTRTPFHRTPKYRVERGHARWWRSTPYRLTAPKVAIAELATGTTVLTVFAAAVISGSAVASGSGLLLGLGTLFVGLGALAQFREGAESPPGAVPPHVDRNQG